MWLSIPLENIASVFYLLLRTSFCMKNRNLSHNRKRTAAGKRGLSSEKNSFYFSVKLNGPVN